MFLQMYTYTGKMIHLCSKKKKKEKNQVFFFPFRKENKQGWKPCPAATISRVTWWVFSFKRVRTSDPRRRYRGLCHSHIKLPSAGLGSHGTCCQIQKQHCFSCLESWGSRVGDEMPDIGEVKTETWPRNTTWCTYASSRKTWITQDHRHFPGSS